MFKKISFLFYFISCFSFGQQESYYSLYRYTLNVINPAYAGAESSNSFSFTSRQQWSSVPDAPSTLAFSYSSARKNKVGLGISVVSDKVFVEQQTFAYVDFSYRLQTTESTQLFLGIKAGGNFYNADPTKLDTYTFSPDPLKQPLSKFNPNVGVGAFLKGELFWMSLSIPRLFNVNRDQNLVFTAKDRVHSYLGGGMDLPMNSNLLLKPALMLRKVNGLPMTTDLSMMFSWQNNLDVGLSYRTRGAISLLSLVSIGAFDIGYAYEVPTESSLSQLNLKVHEIVLRIRLGESNAAFEEETQEIVE